MAERVSVLICTYNYARYLPQCLESVLHQTRPPDEIIVLDDGSSDDTPKLMERFPQVRYAYQQNTGKATAFGRAFALSNGEIICHLDADDYWQLDKLERVLPWFDRDPTLGGVIHEVRYVDAQGRDLHRQNPLHAEPMVLTPEDTVDTGFIFPLPGKRGRWFGSPNSACVRRDTVADLLPFPRAIAGSVDGMLVGGAIRRRLACLPEALANCRIHGANASNVPIAPADTDPTIAMWKYLADSPKFSSQISKKHASMLRAAILERTGYLACRTGVNVFSGAWASVLVPLILLKNGYRCNWKHLALPIACLLPLRRVRQPQ